MYRAVLSARIAPISAGATARAAVIIEPSRRRCIHMRRMWLLLVSCSMQLSHRDLSIVAGLDREFDRSESLPRATLNCRQSRIIWVICITIGNSWIHELCRIVGGTHSAP
jgi:hypothetical protein